MKVAEVISWPELYWRKGDPVKLIGYHSTNSRIRRFSLTKSPGGLYFHGLSGFWDMKNTIRAEITFKSPLITNDRRMVQHSDQERRQHLLNQGYDGMVWVDDTGNPIEIVAFNPNQVNILDNPTLRRNGSL